MKLKFYQFRSQAPMDGGKYTLSLLTMALDRMSGYFQARVDLHPGKALPVSIEYEYGWTPESISSLRSEQISLEPYRESQNSLNNDYAIPFPISSQNKNITENLLIKRNQFLCQHITQCKLLCL